MSDKFVKVPPVLYRQGTSEMQGDGSVRLSISSDAPYRRYDWWNDEEYYEVLDHAPGGADLTRIVAGTALLYNHNRDIQLGKITKPELESGKCFVTASLSSADDVKGFRTRMDEGILKDCSVGYQIDDEGTKIGEKDGIPMIRFGWAPFEASMVTIPADITVGVGREREMEKPKGEPRSIKIRGIETEEKKVIDNVVDDTKKTTSDSVKPIEVNQTKAMTPEEQKAADEKAKREREEHEAEINRRSADLTKKELERQKEIRATAGVFATRGVTEADTNAFLDDPKKSPADFKCWILENKINAKPVNLKSDGLASDIPGKDLERFSLLKLLRELGETGHPTGVEKEVTDEARRKSGRAVNGVTIPTEALAVRGHRLNPYEARMLRDLTVGTSTAGGDLVATDLLASSFIDVLRNRLIVSRMGARMLDGLVGNVAVPRQTGSATAYWVSETGATTESNSAFDQVLMTPHGVSAIQDYSKLLTIQSSLGVEDFIRSDISKVLALAIDYAALAGTGSSNMPLGVINTTGIGSVAIGTNGGVITWPSVVALETAVATSNADYGSLGYVTNPKVRGQAKITPRQSAGVEGHFIWPAPDVAPFPNDPAMGMLNGYKAGVSNQVPANLTKGTASGTCSALIFGNWDDLIIGQWNGVDIVVDPYTQAPNRVIRYVVSMWVDVMVRHPASFAADLDIVTG